MNRFLIENPLVVIFALLILTLIVYFAFEVFAKHKRLEKHYTTKKVLWGAALIAIAAIILFTPAIGFVVNALFHPGSTSLVTILSSHLACSSFFDLGGVRSEDDIVITKNNEVNLTDVPKTIDEIEAICQGG